MDLRFTRKDLRDGRDSGSLAVRHGARGTSSTKRQGPAALFEVWSSDHFVLKREPNDIIFEHALGASRHIVKILIAILIARMGEFFPGTPSENRS